MVDPIEDLDSWLELATMCRKENMMTLCHNILKQLGSPVLTPSLSNSDSPSRVVLSRKTSKLNLHSTDIKHIVAKNRIVYASYKYLWATGDKEAALSQLSVYIRDMPDLSFVPNVTISESGKLVDLKTFRVMALLKKAEWLREIQTAPFSEVLETVLEARELAPDLYSVWHAWAVTNYNQLQKVDVLDLDDNSPQRDSNSPRPRTFSYSEISPRGRLYTPPVVPAYSPTSSPNGKKLRNNSISSNKDTNDGTSNSRKKSTDNASTLRRSGAQGLSLANLLSVDQETVGAMTYVTESIRGFVKSIVLGKGQPIAYLLQDTLRLLTLWFTYGMIHRHSRIHLIYNTTIYHTSVTCNRACIYTRMHYTYVVYIYAYYTYIYIYNTLYRLEGLYIQSTQSRARQHRFRKLVASHTTTNRTHAC